MSRMNLPAQLGSVPAPQPLWTYPRRAGREMAPPARVTCRAENIWIFPHCWPLHKVFGATLLPVKEAPSEVQLHTTGTPGLSASTKPLLSFPSPASVFPGFSFQPLWSQEMRFVCSNSGSAFWQQTKAACAPPPPPLAFVSPSSPALSQPSETCPQAAGAAFSLAWNLKCSLESVSCCCQNLASLCTYWSYGGEGKSDFIALPGREATSTSRTVPISPVRWERQWS